MKYSNMKIPVENNLDEIVAELERLGYRRIGLFCVFQGKTFICANNNGRYAFLKDSPAYCKTTTLAELKEM